jgi:hypothetical protein
VCGQPFEVVKMSDFSKEVKRIIQTYRPCMITVAQLYTGGVGSEIVRRLAGHPPLQLVGVLVHSAEKTGRDSGELDFPAVVAGDGLRVD